MLYSAVFIIHIISHSMAELPIRIPAVVWDHSSFHCNELPSADVQQLKYNVTAAIESLSTDRCNCSSLLNNETRETCLSSCCHDNRLLFDVDWNNGTSYIAPNSGLTWTQQPYDPSSAQPCDSQSVLQIDFLSACNITAPNCKLKFDFYLQSTYSGWNFNIGDSRSNNGYGGDAGHTSNAAEIHNIDRRFLIYSNTLPDYASNSLDGRVLIANVMDIVTDHFTVVIGDEFVMFDNNNGVQRSYRSRYLFTLNGQPTSYGPVDYLIYLGMNRVISSNSRSGNGLCRVTIRALHC